MRFELTTPCLQGRCNNHYATPAIFDIIWFEFFWIYFFMNHVKKLFLSGNTTFTQNFVTQKKFDQKQKNYCLKWDSNPRLRREQILSLPP